MPKKTEPTIDVNALAQHLESIEDMSEDDGYEASNASQALCHVRKMFYGTAFEQVLTDAIIVCDTVTKRAQEL